MARLTEDERRTARLILWDALADGRLTGGDLARPEVADAVLGRARPSAVVRAVQRRGLRRGALSYVEQVVEPVMAAREAVLGAAAFGAPRVLVSVGGFPHERARDDPQRYGTDAFARFHATLRAAGVPYLVALTPEPAPDEAAMLHHLRGDDGVTFALRGSDRRTRFKPDEYERELDEAERALHRHGIPVRVFVPPPHTFRDWQYLLLARRFEVICGGPETVSVLGYHSTPQWRGKAVYCPSYPPLNGTARGMLPLLGELVARRAALWVPVSLRWGEDADADVEHLAGELAGIARPWTEFLAAATVSRT